MTGITVQKAFEKIAKKKNLWLNPPNNHFLGDTHKYCKPFEKPLEPTIGLISERVLVKKLMNKKLKNMFPEVLR